jgi:hypothetical protein
LAKSCCAGGVPSGMGNVFGRNASPPTNLGQKR